MLICKMLWGKKLEKPRLQQHIADGPYPNRTLHITAIIDNVVLVSIGTDHYKDLIQTIRKSWAGQDGFFLKIHRLSKANRIIDYRFNNPFNIVGFGQMAVFC